MTRKERIAELEREIRRLKEENEALESLDPLNKYLGKYLYFEGYEDGSSIIRIDSLTRAIDDEILWTGMKIDLQTENSMCGPGVIITYPEEETFEILPYFTNAYEYGDEDIEPSHSVSYLDSWLGDDSLGLRKEGEKTHREIDPSSVLDNITNLIKWYLPKECGGEEGYK